MSQLPIPEIPSWRQPLGTWRARGACAGLMRAGLGLDQRGSMPERDMDDHGFTLWHYWANSPSPHERFLAILQLAGDKHCDHLARGGEHPWHYLLAHGQVPALQLWADHLGVPCEAPPTASGHTFAHCAAWSGLPEAIDLFSRVTLAHINAADQQGLTPLVIAIHRGGAPLAQAFLQAGADPMIADKSGRTALHHAAQYGDIELVTLLEDAGGDAGVADHQGLCPASLVRARQHAEPSALQGLAEHWERRRNLQLPF